LRTTSWLMPSTRPNSRRLGDGWIAGSITRSSPTAFFQNSFFFKKKKNKEKKRKAASEQCLFPRIFGGNLKGAGNVAHVSAGDVVERCYAAKGTLTEVSGLAFNLVPHQTPAKQSGSDSLPATATPQHPSDSLESNFGVQCFVVRHGHQCHASPHTRSLERDNKKRMRGEGQRVRCSIPHKAQLRIFPRCPKSHIGNFADHTQKKSVR
jgi:hypothetical protein